MKFNSRSRYVAAAISGVATIFVSTILLAENPGVSAAIHLGATITAGDEQDQSLLNHPKNKTVALPQLPNRNPPQTDFPIVQSLSVADFGARPNDGKDDLDAIRRALAAATQATGATAVVFPKGQYDIYLPEDPENDLIYRATGAALALYKANHVILEGRDSTIVLHQSTLGFLTLLACQDVIVRDLTVEWSVPPFAQGFVRAIDHDAGCFEFDVEPGFLSMDNPVWKQPNRKSYDSIRWGMLKDRNVPGRLKADVPNVFFVSHWDQIADRRFRMHLKDRNQVRFFEVSDRYVHVDRNGGSLCVFNQCERVTCQRITCYTSPGLDYGGSQCSEIALLECKVLIKPGYWHTSNADGMHFSQARIGPWVENCVFEGMADDGANLYTPPVFCTQVVSETEFVVEQKVTWQPGDRIVAFEPKTGALIGQATVTAVEIMRDARAIRLTVDKPISGMETGNDKHSRMFFNLDNCSSGFVFRNNVFRNVRRFGILMQSHSGVVENNTFDGVSATAIYIRNSSGWPEGFATGNIVIRGNQIRNCGFDHNLRGAYAADISVLTRRLDGRNAEYRAVSRVLIDSNTIINTRRRAISVASATDVSIRNNVIKSIAPAPSTFQGEKITPIQLRDIDRVQVRDNTIFDSRDLSDKPIAVTGRCSGIEVSGNSIAQTTDDGKR